jgi:hypothetical protein
MPCKPTLVSAVHVSGLPGFSEDHVSFACKVDFPIAVGFFIFSVLASQDICQLFTIKVHATMLSSLQWFRFSGWEFGVPKRPPTQRALDAGESARFQAFSSPQSFSPRTAFRPPPQRK